MTLQREKERYFAAHWGQCVLRSKNWNLDARPDYPSWEINSGTLSNNVKSENWYVELTSISKISDEDAIELFNIEGSCNLESVKYEDQGFWKKWKFKGSKGQFFLLVDLTIKQGDFLRSRSYALPFGNRSVQELIELGWLKLREE